MLMNRNSAAVLFASAGLAIALLACNQTDRVAAPEGTGTTGVDMPAGPPTPFENALTDLKRAETDPDRVDAGIRDLMSRYGYPVSEGAGAPLVPLGKAVAAQAVSGWKTAKYFQFGIDLVIYGTVTVPVNGTLIVQTSHPAGSTTDPYLIAFYKTGNANYTQTKVVGSSDDVIGTDAKFVWVNNSGASRVVTYIACGYNTSLRGPGSVLVQCTGLADKTVSGYMGGVLVRQNMAKDIVGCSPLSKTSLSLYIQTAGADGNGAVAVNEATMRGAYIYETAVTVQLADPMPYAAHNVVLGFSRGLDGFPCGKNTCYESISYYTYQLDYHTCP